MSAYILCVGHVCALDLIEGEVLDGVDLGNFRVYLSGSVLVARIGVELLCPCSLEIGSSEPLCERLYLQRLSLGTAGLVEYSEILGYVIGAVSDVYELPGIVLDRMLGAGSCGVYASVQLAGVEGGYLYVALVERIEAFHPSMEMPPAGEVGSANG